MLVNHKYKPTQTCISLFCYPMFKTYINNTLNMSSAALNPKEVLAEYLLAAKVGQSGNRRSKCYLNLKHCYTCLNISNHLVCVSILKQIVQRSQKWQ